MTQLDTPLEEDDIPEAIVEWQPQRGPLVGRWDGPVVAIATIGALAVLGFTAAAYVAGRAQGRRTHH